ncbi:MAG: hypothetical protein ACK526_15525 [Planctomyces sp.]
MINHSLCRDLLVVVILACSHIGQTAIAAAKAESLNLTNAQIVGVQDGTLAAKAADILTDEIAKRTGIVLPVQKTSAASGTPAILIRTVSEFDRSRLPSDVKLPGAADSFAIWIEKFTPAPSVVLLGYDDRATLFAAGRLLRMLSMTKGRLELSSETRVTSAPDSLIRGHQLGYRAANNTYEAWDLGQYEQYLRDLMVFGVNAIELIPPARSDEPLSPHMKIAPWKMNQDLCELIASYGLDLWMWVPVDSEVADPAQAEEELNRRRELFRTCGHISDIFVPGGDPGDTDPEVLMPYLKRLAAVLHESHPNAGLWVSNQGFTSEQNRYLYDYLRTTEPDWLAGIVFGPWSKESLAEVRGRTPRKYRIRDYPDICHTLRCQYPVLDWDPAFSQALGREPFNPRPKAMAHIHNSTAGLTEGFITYSDGVPDDVNKIVWSAFGWDRKQDVRQVLVEYGRYFIDHQHGEAIADGLLALEENWRGPLQKNDSVEKTFTHWQNLRSQLPDAAQNNWRFELALLRADYDAYLKRRQARHLQIEQEAKDVLRNAATIGTESAISKAQSILAQVKTDTTAEDLRKRLTELGHLLFRNIGLQLNTPDFGASNPERGAVLDYLDYPLNDSPWLESQFAEILKLSDKAEQLSRLQRIIDWENPGPGSFYDDLGCVDRQPHLLPNDREKAWHSDPGFISSPQSEFIDRLDRGTMAFKHERISWLNQAETLFGAPLRMRYTKLDPQAKYRLRVTYAGRFRATMRLVADQTHEIHGPLPQPSPVSPVEFEIPQAATADGALDLQWELIAQRGCQVAEVWLIRQ